MKLKLIIMMIFISSIVAQDTNTTYEKHFLKPFVGVDYNVFAVDKLSLSNRSFGVNFGYILQDQTKVELSYFEGKEESSSKKYTVKDVELSYGYSFNNNGLHRGYVIDLGLANTKLDKTTYTRDVNNTKISHVDYDKSLNIVVGLGYEYLVDPHFILNIEHKLSVYPLNITKKMERRLVNTKFSVKYLFD